MSWNVCIYKKDNGEEPLKDFINSLPKKHQAKALWEISLLNEFGTNLKEPYAKSIAGESYKGLWELRIKFSSDISRIFYFMPVGDTFILLHGFLKKTDKIPTVELEKAKSYMLDYQRRATK